MSVEESWREFARPLTSVERTVQPDLRKRKRGFVYNLKKRWLLFLTLVPAVAYVLVFSYAPMTGLILAFKRYQYKSGICFSPWNGLQNFEALMISGRLGMATRNTLLYSIAFSLLGVVFEWAAPSCTTCSTTSAAL